MSGRRCSLVFCFALAGCGGAGFATDDALSASDGPAIAEAIQARDAALDADDLRAAGDHQTHARLLQEGNALSAELSEVEQEHEAMVVAERELLASMREQDEATLRERAAGERAEAERVVDGQARIAFERASEDEPRRHRNQRRERRATRKRAARVMVRRTRLTLEAARGLGATEADLASVQPALDHARELIEGTSAVEAVEAAEQAWTLAQGALRRARAAQPTRPEAGAAQELTRVADEQGFVLSHTPRGASLVLTGGVSESQVEHIVALAQAYPLGVIQVDSRETSIPIARRQSAALIAALVGATSEERVHGEVSTGRARLEVVFTAYVLGP